MTTNLLTCLLALSLMLPVAASSPTEGKEAEPAPEWKELFGDATLGVVWQSAEAASGRIATALRDKRLEGVADFAETIHLAAHALMDRLTLPEADGERRLDAALEQAARLADEVLEGAAHGEPDVTAAAFRRLRAALDLAKRRLPAEVTTAPPGTPRFAKAGEHSHAHGAKP